MPSSEEITGVLVELYKGLSPYAISKLIGPGLISASPAHQVKFFQVLDLGVQDEADLPFPTAVEEFMGTTMAKSAIAALDDVGISRAEMLDIPVQELRRLLEEHWAAELERVPDP